MGKIILNEIDYSGGNANVIRLTQAEYDALPPSKLTDNNVYMITDTNGDGSQFQPVIYSEDEREIGAWTDGKPLYQKTIDCGIAPAQGEIKSVAHGIASIDTVISLTGYAKRASDGFTLFLPNISRGNVTSQTSLSINSTNVNINNGSGSDVNANYNVYLTIQYTKTTDIAGSGIWTPQGVPAVHYSTDEKVIGTWIDGSTVYEKTMIVPNVNISSSWVEIVHEEIDNIYMLLNCNVTADVPADSRSYILPHVSGWNADSINISKYVEYNTSLFSFSIKSNGSSYSNIEVNITIQYTKTSQGGN